MDSIAGSGQGGGISFEDEGYSSDATAQQGRSGTGTGGTDSSSSNADAAGWRAAESMARAVESSSNTEQKATVLSTSHGQSLLEIAEAIKNGTANDSDAQALIACAERLRSFANTCTRTSEKVGEAKDAMEDHHDALAAAESTGGGGADSEEVKSYSLESARAGASGGRHTGRYRSGGYSQAGSTGRGEGGISRSASRAMGF